MDKSKLCLPVIFTLLSMCMALFIVNPVSIWAEEKEGDKCFMVRIQGKGPAAKDQVVNLTPQYLAVPAGSCIIFINWVRADEVMVSFEEGKTCANVTQAPSGFGLSDKGCYVTDYLPMGKTSSLMFMEAGDFRYDIKLEGMAAPVAQGQITVTKP